MRTLFPIMLLILLLIAPAMQTAAQDSEPISVTITEEDINTRLAERDGPFTWTVDFSDGVGELATTITRNDSEFNVVIIIIGVTGEEIGMFNAVDVEITDADGNPVEIDPQRSISDGLNALERSIRQAVAAAIDASSPNLSLNSVVIEEGLATLEFVLGAGGLPDFRERELPANVTRNDDGTLTVAITEAAINDAMAAVADRRETVLSLTAQIDGLTAQIDGLTAGTMTFAIEMQPDTDRALCNNEIIGGTVVFVVDHKADDFADIVFAGSGDPLTCGAETLNERQSQRFTTLVVNFMNRYVQLQTRGSSVIGFETAPGVIEVQIAPARNDN